MGYEKDAELKLHAVSATVTSLAACIGLQEGFGSSSFAIAVVLACVVAAGAVLGIVMAFLMKMST